MTKLSIMQFVIERREEARMMRSLIRISLSKSILALYVSLLILNLSNVSLSQSHRHHSICSTFPSKKQAALFVFGDSFFHVGNNNYLNTTLQSNFPPYGQTYFKYPSGRPSNGRVIPDFIAQYAKLPLIPAYLFPEYHNDINQYIHYGVNFASGGSGALVETNQGKALSLESQANFFREVSKQIREKVGTVEAEELLSRAVNIISIGGNDYGIHFLSEMSGVVFPYTDDEFVDFVIGNITTTIKKIYDEGGRKFGLLNVAPMHCLPFLRRLLNSTTISACLEGEVSRLSRLHNDALPKALQKIEKELKGFRYSIMDYYGAIVELMTNPSQYGFKEGSRACCGDGAFRGDNSCGSKVYELCDNADEHVFFDAFHPTEKAGEHYARLMWNGGNKNVIKSYSLKQLFYQV